MSRSNDRTALVWVLGTLEELDTKFAELEGWKRSGRGIQFAATPSHRQGHTVLLGASGTRGSGNLYVFVGRLLGCIHEGKRLSFEEVERFACPVTATYGDHVHRDDLLGDREGWGPSEFNYVLPVALEQVPREAEQLLRHDPRGPGPT